jgi:transposase
MPEARITRILRLSGDRVYQHLFDEVAQTVTCGVRPVAATPYCGCPGCGISTQSTVGSPTERRVRDLPWGPWQVWLVVEIQPVACRRCGRHRERIPFLAGKAQCTARFEAAVARECRDAPVRRVAAHWGLAAETVRLMDQRTLQRWATGRPRARIVYDKFHMLKRATAAVDETRRAEFFRKGGRLRGLVRGKRWLLLTRWGNLDRTQRQPLTDLFAGNRRLAKAYLFRDQLTQLWTYTYEAHARRFLPTWMASWPTAT